MLEIIENSNSLLYIKASGEVTAADSETVLIPAADDIGSPISRHRIQ